MSLALSAVLLLVLFLPGVIARRSYLSYPFAKKYSSSTIADEVALSVIPALVLQFLMIELVARYTPYRVDLQELSAMLVGGSDATTAIAFQNLQTHLRPIALYNFVLWTAAAIIGIGLRSAVIFCNLDLHFNVLRFNNEWYYFLTGRQWNLRLNDDFDMVLVDAMISTPSGPVIYSGILDNYKLARDGNLDYLCLRDVDRTLIPGVFAPAAIPGKGLIVKYENTINLNLTFWKEP
jgi:hypothetical protein